MKTKMSRPALALFALCLASSLTAGINPASPTGSGGEIAVHSVAARIHANGDSVTPGTSRIMVSARLGTPNAVLPDGSWLYREFRARRSDGAAVGSGTLVVRFTASTVTSLSLVDDPTALALLRSPKAIDQRRLAAADGPR
ncbi:MAG TPA: hypothetical protein VG734_05945 [Lacunisphaera sp.]|nr:hypothetical protein [Lacunisphaera sp.]